MESKMALTTPSTSRCVRSGKSVHSFCTSSERIILTPHQGLAGPALPRTRGQACAHAVRKLCHTQDRSGWRRLSKKRRLFQLLLLLGGLFAGFGLLLERSAQDVAERSAGVGRTVLRHLLLLLGDLHRLDREVRLLRTVEAGDHRVELLADLEALGALLVAVAAEIGALDEAHCAVVADLHVQARV